MLAAQSWITFLTLLGAVVVAVSALSGYFTLQADHQRAARAEAALRQLNEQYEIDTKRGSYDSPWYQWAAQKRERERARLGLPIYTWGDAGVVGLSMTRVSLAVSLASVKGDLVAVGAGLVLSSVASVWSVWL